MNEVRDIVSRMMEEPAPPQRSADEVLAIARQAKRRRAWAGAAVSGALTLVAVTAVSVTVRSLLPRTPPDDAIAAPIAQVAPAHGAVMAQRIVATLPAGLTPGPIQTFSDDPRPVAVPDDGVARILAATVVRVQDGNGQGEIFAYLVDDGRPEVGDPARDCASAEADAQRESCTTMTVDGVTVRLVVSTDPERGQRVEVTRFLAGGRLVVGAWQALAPVDAGEVGGPPVWLLMPLADPIDPDVLVALATDPAMLPG